MAIFSWLLQALDYCWSGITSHPYIFGLIFLLGLGLELSAGSSDSNVEFAEARGLGLETLCEPSSAFEGFALDARIDIVAVHGFNGHSLKSWTSQANGLNWLKTLLPIDVGCARIMTYGYDSGQGLRNIAMNLVTDLRAKRDIAEEIGNGSRPIIFIAHNIGGNIVKQALIHARTSQDPQRRDIFVRTCAILFFGTRQKGSYYDSLPEGLKLYIDILDYIYIRFVMPMTRWSALSSIRLLKDGDIEKTNAQFNRIMDKEPIRIACFYEEENLQRFNYKLVSQQAASIPGSESIGIPKDHVNMVKFDSSYGPHYGRVIACLKRIIRDIGGITVPRTPSPIIDSPSYIAAPLNIPQQGVRVLCFDGGGVRGLSSLLILKNLMYSLKRRRNMRDLPKPCEVFDIIAGTSTGGLIAIMIGRLRMDVDSCIIAYQKLSRDIFERKGWHYWGGQLVMGWDAMRGNSWFDPRKLEQAIMEILTQRLPEDELDMVQGNAREVPLLESQAQLCKTFVCAIDADTHQCVRFRNYSVPGTIVDQDIIDCAVVDAARATSAAPLFFPTAKIGTRYYFDGALKNNNPVLELVKEIRGPLGNPQINSLISIGTGKPKDTSHSASAVGVISTLKDMATDTEHHHHDVMTDHAYADIRDTYFRFNVESGLSEIGIDRWDLLPDLTRKTKEYLTESDTRETIDRCVGLL